MRHNVPIFYLRLTAAFTTKNQFLYGHRLLANTQIQFFCTCLACTHQRPKHSIEKEG